MDEVLKARVVEIILDKYILELSDGKYVEAIVKGNVKKNNTLIVGDLVNVVFYYDKYLITEVLTRKNSLIRPKVSNIDQLVIVISLDSPKPDYTLLDKEIILCKSKNITPLIVVNKIDLESKNEGLKKELKYIADVYGSLVSDIIYTSTIDDIGINKLKSALEDKISAFSGNSGVGKSSITSKILSMSEYKGKLEEIEIGQIGKKTNKGKHTTKYIKLYNLENNSYLFDTPGFSSFELYDINYKELKKYYDDFNEHVCDYEDCNHINEDISVCAVKKAVTDKKIDKLRYERYEYLFSRLKEIDDKKYK